MKNVSRETRAGWTVSVTFHVFLLFLFLVISIPDVIQKQEFIEVIWGSPAVSKPAELNIAPSSLTEASPPTVSLPDNKKATLKPTQPVFLPERRLSHPQEEPLPFPRTEKIEMTERSESKKSDISAGIGEREPATGQKQGESDRTGPVSGPPGSSIGPTVGSGGLRGDVEKGVSFSIQWMEGGTRKKISGELPQYPEGVNVVAQVKILTVVAPDGTVKSTQPAQKANTRLEEAAMKNVRFWKFEPLRSSQPQVDQNCVITFLFTLK